MLAVWSEQLRGGDISINEVRQDAILSVLIYNKEEKQALLMAGAYFKEKPTAADIEFFFTASEPLLKHLKECGIDV